MRSILFVIESLSCGGAEKSLVTLLQNIDYKQYRVDLILIRKGGEFEKFVPEEVSIIYRDSVTTLSFFKLIIPRLKFWINKKRKKNKNYNSAHIFWKAFGSIVSLNKKDYDVAIAYSQGFATYFVAEKTTANKKFSWLNTDYEKAKHFAKFDYIRYAKFNSIVCVSPECKISLLKAMNSISKTLPTSIIKDITDDTLVKKMSLSEKGFSQDKITYKILTVCRLDKLKGLHLAIEACEILKNKGYNIKWYVIGEGSERKFLENQIENKQLKNHFQLLGFKENPYPFMKTCDLYVQTSLFEGLGLTVIEAAVLNKPIVTTNFATASSIVTQNETGLICEMNAISISEHILKYLTDDKFTSKIIDNLSKLKNTDKEKSLEKFYKLINS